MYGIREYDANICLAAEGEREYLYHIITENDSNASGNLMLGILVNAKIDYIVVRKEYTGTKAALNGGGCVEVGQTDNYILYYVNQEQLKEDLYHTYDSDWKTDAGICNVEDVMIKGLTQEQQFLFMGMEDQMNLIMTLERTGFYAMDQKNSIVKNMEITLFVRQTIKVRALQNRL